MIIRVDIVDTEPEHESERIMETYYLVNPDEKKLDELQRKLDDRFDEEGGFDSFDCVDEYIHNNFRLVEIPKKEINW